MTTEKQTYGAVVSKWINSSIFVFAGWLSGHDPGGLHMDPSERQTLLKFYCAASMMPKRSTCFARMESESCRHELTIWMSREAAGDPRFLLDYKTLAPALGLPAMSGTGGS